MGKAHEEMRRRGEKSDTGSRKDKTQDTHTLDYCEQPPHAKLQTNKYLRTFAHNIGGSYTHLTFQYV